MGKNIHTDSPRFALICIGNTSGNPRDFDRVGYIHITFNPAAPQPKCNGVEGHLPIFLTVITGEVASPINQIATYLPCSVITEVARDYSSVLEWDDARNRRIMSKNDLFNRHACVTCIWGHVRKLLLGP